MSTAILSVTPLPVTRPAPAGTVFLPKEHGSWSLALEPLALGLLVAPSWAGGALAGAVLAGFFARRPLKAAIDPLPSVRRRAAREALVLWSALAVAGLVEVGVLAGWAALWPLLPAALFGGVFIWFDARNNSRAVIAELAGCTAFAFVPTAVATLAGWPAGIALTLAALAAARSLPTILAVRASLRAAKGEPADGAGAWIASLLAFGGVAALVESGRAPAIAGILGGLLLLRTAWLVGPWRPAWPARRIGMLEAVLGILYVVLLSSCWPAT